MERFVADEHTGLKYELAGDYFHAVNQTAA